MFHLLSKGLLRIRIPATITHVHFLHNPFVKSISHTPETTKTEPSLTVSYLMNSCGFSSKQARSATKYINLQTTENPDSVLSLLQEYGFTKADITTTISKIPALLLSSPDKTLKPKLEFFQGKGFSGSNLAKILSANPDIFRRSLEKTIIPSFDFLKNMLATNGDIACALRLTMRLSLRNSLANVEILRNHGVPEAKISKLFVTRPCSLMRCSVRFVEIVRMIKDMGFDPKTLMFVHAVGVMSYMCKSTWERKLAVYRSIGWSYDEIFLAFKKQPFCIGMSDAMIQGKMDFFVNALGWGPSFLSQHPTLLMLSLEKRLVPRCSVLKILMSKGMIKRKTSVKASLLIPEKVFIQRYVTKYKEEIPEVVRAHQGKLGFVGWDDVCEDVGQTQQ